MLCYRRQGTSLGKEWFSEVEVTKKTHKRLHCVSCEIGWQGDDKAGEIDKLFCHVLTLSRTSIRHDDWAGRTATSVSTKRLTARAFVFASSTAQWIFSSPPWRRPYPKVHWVPII
jgi:hypothetical protein